MKVDSPVAKKIISIFAVVFWLAVWQLAAQIIGNRVLLVSPVDVLKRLFELALEADFWHTAAVSLSRIVFGYIAGFLIGIIAAALAAAFYPVEALLRPLVFTIKNVPVASFIVIALIWLSSANLAQFISFLMVFPIIYTNVLDGIRTADRELLEMSRIFGMSPMRRFRLAYVPAVQAHLCSACRITLGMAWKSGIAAEIIGLPDGSIGEKLYSAKIYLNTPELLAWTVTIVALSLAFEKLFMLALSLLFRVNARERPRRRYVVLGGEGQIT